MTQAISRQNIQMNYEEDNWDDIEIPETGLPSINNNDYGLSTTTRAIYDSSDYDSDYDFDKVNSSKSTPASSSSSLNKVKEMMINSGVVITNNDEEFSGLITRIGGDNNKVIADDWDNDIEIPEDGFSNLTISTNNILDNKEQNTTFKNPITSPKKLVIKQVEDPLKHNKKALESVDDDFDFSGVDLNKLDFSTKAIKSHYREEEGNLNDKDPFELERYPSRNSSRLSTFSTSPSPAPTNGSQSAFESDDDDLFDDIQFPEHMDSLTLISYNDDNDFESGLDINDESVFHTDQLKNKNIVTRPNPTHQKHQKRTRRESFTIEFNTSTNNSRSSTPSTPPLTNNKVLPKTANNISSQISPLLKLKTNKAFSKSLTSLKTQSPTPTKNTTKITFQKNQTSYPKSPQSIKNPKLPIKGLVKKSISSISLVNNNNNSLARSKSIPNANFTSKSSKKTITSTSTPPLNKRIEILTKRIPSNNKKRHQQNQQNINFNNTHNNNTLHTISNTNLTIPEIMRKPTRRRNFGDGTELDGFDDLPVNVDRERPYSFATHDRNNSFSSVGSKTDNCDNRRNHKKNRKRKKPHLIRNLNANMNLKVVGEMVYNPTMKRWDGNETALKEFDNALASPTRPALISNMNNRNTNTKSFQVVGKMKFDPTKMCWNNDSSDEEEEILARFDCDDDCDDFISTFIDDSDNDSSSVNIKKIKSRTRQRDTGDDGNDFQVGSEFDITSGFLAALLASERQHRNEITRWYPDALSKRNDSRFGLRDISLQRSYLYDLRNFKKGNTNYSPSSKNPKINNHHNRSGGLFEAAINLTRHERRHFR